MAMVLDRWSGLCETMWRFPISGNGIGPGGMFLHFQRCRIYFKSTGKNTANTIVQHILYNMLILY